MSERHNRRRSFVPPQASIAWSVVVARVVGVFLLLALVAGGWMFVKERQRVIASLPEGEHVGIVLDVSPSVGFSCDTVLLETLNQLEEREIGKDSSVVVVSTGDADSAYFPKLVLTTSVEGGSGGPFGGDTMADELLAACKAVPPTTRSPILAAISMAVEQLKSQGCGTTRSCSLVVLSDLVEGGDADLMRRMAGALPTTVSPRVDNTGIEVTLCGMAETKVAGTTGLNAAPLMKAWASEFTQAPTFRPYCGTDAPGGLALAQ